MRTETLLTTADVDAVRALAAAAEETDGVAPLNEDALLALTHPDGETHVLLDGDDGLVGYATRDRHGHGQLVVHPDHRRQGNGCSLAEALDVDAWWAFGDLPGARALAASLGLAPTRELLILQRDLVAAPVEAPASADIPRGSGAGGHMPPIMDPARDVRGRPDGTVTIRPFTDADLDALLAINAAAFAHHPEQGDLDVDAFRARAAEPWFRPEDILLAELDGVVVGFHWTKRHGDGLGEVYVLAVHPDAAGHGLGRRLLDAGLAHLADVGCERVILYVDGAEERPVALYRSSRFDLQRRDVSYAPDRGEAR